MIDLDAPILPGNGAAGIWLDIRVETVLAEHPGTFKSEKIANTSVRNSLGMTKHRSPAVDLWEENGQVIQIMVHDGYRGKLDNRVGIASTIADIQRIYGYCQENEEDNLIINGVPGLCFTVTGLFPKGENPFDPDNPIWLRSKVDWIYVYRESGKGQADPRHEHLRS